MLPTASDLDDPDGFVHREQLDFSELDKMLGEAASGSAGKPNLKKDEPGSDGTGHDDSKGDSEGDDTE
jgi:hypothetical protein